MSRPLLCSSCKKHVSWWTDPDWDGTDTEQTDFHFLLYCIFILKLGASLDKYSKQIYYKSTFTSCSKLSRLTVSTSFQKLNIRTELDLNSENLFRMCSVVTNLVTSLEFQPIRCATTRFHFGRTRNGYVATRFILLSNTAERGATSGCVVAPERSDQSEAWAGKNAKRTRKKAWFWSQQWI